LKLKAFKILYFLIIFFLQTTKYFLQFHKKEGKQMVNTPLKAPNPRRGKSSKKGSFLPKKGDWRQ
jgi:hypothetical protein